MTLFKTIHNASTGEVQTIELSAEEIAEAEAYTRDVRPGVLMNEIRVKRNQLLAETDYLALSDVTLSTEMAEYRQALRDLPANTSDPANPVWPTKPGGSS